MKLLFNIGDTLVIKATKFINGEKFNRDCFVVYTQPTIDNKHQFIDVHFIDSGVLGTFKSSDFFVNFKTLSFNRKRFLLTEKKTRMYEL